MPDVGAQPGGVEAVGADVDLVDGPRLLVGIGLLDDRPRVAIGPAHDAAIARGVVQAGGQQRDGGVALRLLAQQVLEQLAGQQRDVAHGDQHVARLRRHAAEAATHRIGGAQLGLLAHRRHAVMERGLDLLGAEADHHHRMLDAGGRQRIEHVVDHRTPGERVQDLRHARAHARPLACGQDDGRGS